MAVAVIVVFNFTLNCHVSIKYFGMEHEDVNESTLNLWKLVPIIVFMTVHFV